MVLISNAKGIGDRQHVDIPWNIKIMSFGPFFSKISFLKHICKIKYWYVNWFTNKSLRYIQHVQLYLKCVTVLQFSFFSFSLTLSLILNLFPTQLWLKKSNLQYSKTTILDLSIVNGMTKKWGCVKCHRLHNSYGHKL